MALSYDIELDEIRLEENEITRDNVEAIHESLRKIQELLNDINARLKAGGL
jgi:predicted DNA-binding protein YlxM (UPF0122 family)